MKILELIDGPGWCGTKEQTYLVTRGLSQRHQVEIALHSEQHEMRQRLQGIVAIHQYEQPGDRRNPLTRLRIGRRLYHILQQGRFDAVVANSARSYQQLLGVLPWLSRRPLVIAMRRSGYLPNAFSKHLKYRFADKIVVVSDEVTAQLKQHGFWPGKLVSIPSGIDLSRFRPGNEYRQIKRQELGLAETERVFINVANWQPWRKGQDLLLEAFRQLPGECKLLLVGQQTDSPEARDTLARLGLEQRVLGLGFRNDVEQLLQAADYFVFASRSEGIAGAVLQAMASGKVVLSTAAGGIGNYLCDGQNGFLVPVDDHVAFQQRLQQMLELDAATYQKLARRAAESAQPYSIEVNVERWHRLLSDLHQHRHGGDRQPSDLRPGKIN